MAETPDPSIPSGPPGGAGSSAPSGGGGRRRLGPAAPLLVGVLALIALASVYYFFFARASHGRPSSPASPVAEQKPCIAILPFSPAPGSDEVAWIGQAVPQFLFLALEDSPDLRVLTPERLRDLAHGDPPAALEAQVGLARTGGVDFLLRGEVSGKPGAASLKASWIEVASGRESQSWSLDGITPQNLGQKLEEIYGNLRRSLRLEPPGSTEPPVVSMVPVKEAPTRSYLEAAALLAKGDAPGCLKALKEALSLPDFELAHFLQAEAAARAGDPRTAVEVGGRLSKVSRPLPARVTLLTPAILAIYGSGDPRRAVAPLESFLARFPDEKVPLSWLGAIEILLLHEPDHAREHLQKSLALDPSNEDARRLLGRATLESGHPAEAVPLLEASVKSKPDDEGTRLLLADALRRSGRAEESRRALEEILAGHPEDPGAVDLLGSILLDEGKTKEAGDLFGKLVRSRQPEIQAQGEALMARWCLLTGKFNEALTHYRAAVDRAGQANNAQARAEYLLLLGGTQSSLGKHAEALGTLQEVRGIESRVDPDLTMINVVVAQKQYDSARKMLDEQIARWQGRIPAAFLQRLRDSLEGTIALEQGNYPEALKRIQASLPDTGKEPPASEALGRAYLGTGDGARAEQVFRKIAEDPARYEDPVRYLRSLTRLGEACEKQGKKEEALKSYREVLRWWGSADYSLPELIRAQEGLKRLGG